MPTVAERIALAAVPALRAALAGLPGCDGALVQARPDARPQDGDPALAVAVTVGPERWEAATGEADWAYFKHYPVRATAVYRPPVTPPGGTPPVQPLLTQVRAACLAALLHFHPLTTAVPEIDGADPAPELERGWVPPNVGSSANTVVAGVRVHTREPA